MSIRSPHHHLPATRRIRRADVTDAVALAHVQAASWRAAFRGVLSDAYLAGLDTGALASTWSALLADARWPRAATLALEEGDEIVGYSRFYPSDDGDVDAARVAMIGSMYTLPRVWRTGAGGMLMTAVIDALTDAGYSTATLWVLEDNVRAREFYRAAGWVADGTRQTGDGDGDADPIVKLRYRRPLG